MALINFTLGEIKGKVANLVFQGGATGSVLRSKGKPRNTFTLLQSLRRESFSGIAKGWAYTLTEVQRQAWDVLAVGVTFQDAFGNAQAMTGFMLYTQLNSNRLLVGDAYLVVAPANLDVTALASVDLAEAFGTTRSGVVECDPVGTVNEKYAVFGVANLREGRSLGKGDYRFWGAGVDVDTTMFTYNYSSQYALQQTGTFSYVWVRRYNSVNGVMSPGILENSEATAP